MQVDVYLTVKVLLDDDKTADLQGQRKSLLIHFYRQALESVS